MKIALTRDLAAVTKKMIFVRDPYSRLYSAYVDKLIAPNPIYWNKWGVPTIQHFRPPGGVAINHSQMEVTSSEVKNNTTDVCGDDVTFSEFVREALKHLWKKDDHVMPISSLCSPCSLTFDLIGKMESFNDDASMIAESIRVDPKILHFQSLSEEARKDAIEDTTMDALSRIWLRRTLKCISKEDVFRRIWRKLQLRGFMSWRRRFQLSSLQIEHLQPSVYIEMVKEECRLSLNDSKELKVQKKQATLEAFSSLTVKDIERIGEVFRLDFKLFGFDPSTYGNVGGTLGGGHVVNTHAFDWTIDWDLRPALEQHRHD